MSRTKTRNEIRRMLLVLPGFALLCVCAFAQQQASFMQRMEQIMAGMDRGMMEAPMKGEPDHDFAVMMIPHHQGAIDMAKAELLYGKDPQMRRIAQEILVDQQSEIDLMHRWLKGKEQK